MQDRLAAALGDRYVIRRVLGEGGMATVFLATDVRHDRLVALKVLKPDLGAIVGAERFLREIKTTAQLVHPNILPLYDSGRVVVPPLHGAGPGPGREHELLYYVMPYVEGETLADRIARDGPLPPPDVRRIGAEVLDALGYAHGQGIVHRDIKPSNILLSAATGHALVADFGIAHVVSATEFDAITVPGVVLGTPAYMAPEQATSEVITPAADIYSTGLVLYECLTGRRFPPPLLRHAADWSDVPAAYRRTLQRALAPAPGERWSGAAAFRAALRSEPYARRVRGMAAVVGTAAVVLAAALVALLRTPAVPPAPAGEPRLAVLPFTVRGAGGLDYLGDGMVDLLSAKLDGAGTWRISDPRAVLSLVRRAGGGGISPDVGRRVAQRMDATHFVLGDVIEVGPQIRLDAALYGAEPEAGLLAQASVEGGGDDVLGLIDAMAAELLSRYGGGANARLTQAAQMTTQSLPALKAYLRGVRALRDAQFPTAEGALREAVAADSAFALAWYQLSITADWLQRADLAREAADQAVRFAARLPDRERRLLDALRTIRAGDMDASERQLRAILGTHPDDIEAWSQLAELLFHFGPPRGRPLADSRHAWHRLIELDPGWAAAHIHLARIAAAGGDRRALDTLSRRAMSLAPAGDRGLEMRLLRLTLRADAAERERLQRDLADAPDGVLGQAFWSAGTYLDDRDIPLLVFAAATAPHRSREMRAVGFGWLASLETAAGRWRAAWAAVDRMIAVDSVRGVAHGAALALAAALTGHDQGLARFRERLADADWRDVPDSPNPAAWFSTYDGMHEPARWFLLGLAHALAGNRRAARALADSLARIPPPAGTGSLVPDWSRTIRATLAWNDGRPAEALAALDQVAHRFWYQLAVGGVSPGFARFLRGLVLEATGRPADALAVYATFAEAGPEDMAFKAPAHLRQARIHDALGNRDAARRHYGAVAALWGDADPALQAPVAESREALRRLEAREPE